MPDRGAVLCRQCRRRPARPGSRCDACRATRPAEARGSAASRGYGRRWERLRAAILARDVFCQAEGCARLATQIDHRLAKRHGGSDDPSNLQGLCDSCHSRKTAAGL